MPHLRAASSPKSECSGVSPSLATPLTYLKQSLIHSWSLGWNTSFISLNSSRAAARASGGNSASQPNTTSWTPWEGGEQLLTGGTWTWHSWWLAMRAKRPSRDHSSLPAVIQVEPIGTGHVCAQLTGRTLVVWQGGLCRSVLHTPHMVVNHASQFCPPNIASPADCPLDLMDTVIMSVPDLPYSAPRLCP